jgi:hypothetical protein
MSQTKPSIVFAHGIWADGEELPGGGTRVAYDTVTSEIAPYGDAAASQVAERLDTEVLGLLHQATGVPVSTAS